MEIIVPQFVINGGQLVSAALLALLIGGLYAAWRMTPRGERFTSRHTALAVALGTAGTLLISLVLFWQVPVVPLVFLGLFCFTGVSQFIVSALLDDERLPTPAEMIGEAESIAERMFSRRSKEGDDNAT